MKLYTYTITVKKEDYYKYPGIIKTINSNNRYIKGFYAYTAEKIIAKNFKMLRNMDIFEEKIIDIDDDDMDKFEEIYGDGVLDTAKLSTIIEDEGIYKIGKVELYVTTKEYSEIIQNAPYDMADLFSNILNEMIFYNTCNKRLSHLSMFDDLDEFLNIFHPEIQNALKRLLFKDLMEKSIALSLESTIIDNIGPLNYFNIYCHEFFNTYDCKEI